MAQGNYNGVKHTNTIDFIYKFQIPALAKVTYASIVCNFRPLKDEKWRTRIVVGGDKLVYADDVSAPTSSILETKILLNSIISDADDGAKFMSCDLKDFFLATIMDSPEYMRIASKYLPDDIIKKYNLQDKINNGFIYIKIKKGMYGLKQAAVLAYQQLVTHLAKYGYTPIPHTTGMWKHHTRRTKFCLCVDDFGIKYYNNDDINHLLNALKKKYTVTMDWTGSTYCGLTINWNYQQGYVDISMPNYIPQLLQKLQHPQPKKPQYSPHHWNQPTYGKTVQMAETDDNLPILDSKNTKFIQSTVGSLLYYARAIDGTILPALNSIATKQARPTENTMNSTKMLLDYIATYPGGVLRYHKSDMNLLIDSDASYLVLPNAKSRIAGFYQLSSIPPDIPPPISPPINGNILIECKTIDHVVASVAEAETSGVFHNAQTAIPIIHLLEALGHKQPPVHIKTDNSTCAGFANKNIRNKRSKAWDMRYWWLREGFAKKKIKVYWDKGENNDADYYTKHHSPQYHKIMRRRYIFREIMRRLQSHQTQAKRGCVDGQTERQNNLSSDVRNADKLTDDGRSKRIIYPNQ